MTIDQIHSWCSEKIPGIRWRGEEGCGRCPLHDDQHASLSINIKKMVWTCHAGCGDGVLESLARRAGWPWPFKAQSRVCKREIARYDYQDEEGKLLYQVVRFEPKEFRQFNPNSGKWSLKGIVRIPYRLPELLRGIWAGQIFVCEGEKDVDALAALGFVSTCNPGGYGGKSLWKGFAKYFQKGTEVVLVPDADLPGQALMDEVGRQLLARGCKVRRLDLGYPITESHGKDVSDWLGEGHTCEELTELVRKMSVAGEALLETSSTDEQQAERRHGRQADKLIGFGSEVELFHDGDAAYAVIHVDSHRELWSIRSRAFRQWLSRKYYESVGGAPGGQALQDALETLAGRALFDGQQESVHVRVAGDSDALWLDLCNDAWEAVKVTSSGWQVVREPTIRFRRSRGMRPLPQPVIPIHRNLPEQLREFLNTGDQPSMVLITAWLVGALCPHGPYPVLNLQGEQGSAKSTAARILREIIDPNDASLRTTPREERDLIISAKNAWILNLDNLSHLPVWLSDALCRLSTGGGFTTRELYSNDEETIFSATRPVILNGIEEVALRGDLIDRSITVTLPRIPDERRILEADLWGRFEKARPSILGALLGAVSCAMRERNRTPLRSLPRMADFAGWVMVAEPALGWEAGTFLNVYNANRADTTGNAIEASPEAQAVIALVRDTGAWTGTATELLAELDRRRGDGRPLPYWPKSGRGLSNALRRLAPSLRTVGVTVEWGPRQSGCRPLILRLEEQKVVSSSPLSLSSPLLPGLGDASDANDVSDDGLHEYSKSGQERSWEP